MFVGKRDKLSAIKEVTMSKEGTTMNFADEEDDSSDGEEMRRGSQIKMSEQQRF